MIEVPYLWLTLKSYFEANSKNPKAWNWLDPIISSYATSADEIIEEVIKSKPDVIGISCYMWNDKLTLHIAEAIKRKLPNVKIIGGGPALYYERDVSWFIKHWYIDAVCEYAGYGEVFITEYLDGTAVKDIPFAIYPSLRRAFWRKSDVEYNKRSYQWISSYASNKEYLKRFAAEHTNIKFIIDTARGCPYACVFCEWGGGTGTKVNFKSIDLCKEDIDAAFEILRPIALDIINANFCISNDDVEVTQYMCDLNKKYKCVEYVNIYGPTKANKNNLKKIYDLFLENKMMRDIKLSIQTTSDDILKNIKRTDMNYIEQIELFNDIAIKHDVPIRFETMVGLPGETLDSFYKSYGDLASISDIKEPLMHIWQMLPSAPAADPQYSSEMKIKTRRLRFMRDQFQNHVLPRNKYNNIMAIGKRHILEDQDWLHPYDAVVSTFSYSKEDWIKMILFKYYFTFLTKSKALLQYEKLIKKHNCDFTNFSKKLFECVLLKNPIIQSAHNKLLFEMNNSDEPLDIFYVSIQENLPLFSHFTLIKFLILLDKHGFYKDIQDWMITEYDFKDDIIAATNKSISLVYTPIGDNQYAAKDQIKNVIAQCKNWDNISSYS